MVHAPFQSALEVDPEQTNPLGASHPVPTSADDPPALKGYASCVPENLTPEYDLHQAANDHSRTVQS